MGVQRSRFITPNLLGDYQANPDAWLNYGLVYSYDDQSYLTAIVDSTGKSWWNVEDSEGYDYLDRAVLFQKGDSYWTHNQYNEQSGLLIETTTGSLSGSDVDGTVQENLYKYDALGNLVYRRDVKRGDVEESFGYDILNRLTHRNGQEVYTYHDNGNINTKDGTTLEYGATPQPHATNGYWSEDGKVAITYDDNGNMNSRGIDTVGGDSIPDEDVWSFAWTGFDKPEHISNGIDESAFVYNAEHMRVVHTKSSYNVARTKKLYLSDGMMEADFKNEADVVTEWNLDRVRVYIDGPEGKIGTFEFDPENAVNAYDLYVYHYDHLGSIQAITKWGEESGVPSGFFVDDKVGRDAVYSYDAWGLRRDASDWEGGVEDLEDQSIYTFGGSNDITPRGYTGHEMLDDLGLIHMNGRIYDPFIGRFLSPDPIILDPYNLQDYNRYTYVRNNPLKYKDPSGYFLVGFLVGAAGDIGIQIAINVATGKKWHDISVSSAVISGSATAVGVGTISLVKKMRHAKKVYDTAKTSKIIATKSGKLDVVVKTVTDVTKKKAKKELKKSIKTAATVTAGVIVAKHIAGTIEDSVNNNQNDQGSNDDSSTSEDSASTTASDLLVPDEDVDSSEDNDTSNTPTQNKEENSTSGNNDTANDKKLNSNKMKKISLFYLTQFFL